MSYALATPHALGEVDPWNWMSLHLWSPSAVYVLQMTIAGVAVKDPSDALLFVRAAPLPRRTRSNAGTRPPIPTAHSRRPAGADQSRRVSSATSRVASPSRVSE